MATTSAVEGRDGHLPCVLVACDDPDGSCHYSVFFRDCGLPLPVPLDQHGILFRKRPCLVNDFDAHLGNGIPASIYLVIIAQTLPELRARKASAHQA